MNLLHFHFLYKYNPLFLGLYIYFAHSILYKIAKWINKMKKKTEHKKKSKAMKNQNFLPFFSVK